MAKIFSRIVARNPYPTRWKLPGDRTPRRKGQYHIAVAVERCIVHALTFHEIPRRVDGLIDKLPLESELYALSSLRKDYLSFTVYSLKQMVAAGTISADSAWSLFYGEWDKIEEVEEGNFVGMRRAFSQRILEELTNEFGKDFMANLKKKYFESENGGVDLLRFEFLARAGEAGLAQYERYHEWAGPEGLMLGERACPDINEAVKDEYRKALWLEMRLIEGYVGISGLNKDVEEFTLSKDDAFYGMFSGLVTGSIDIFKDLYLSSISGEFEESGGLSLDWGIKAEIGHWMFNLSSIRYNWVSELMDRMNMTGYTERVNEGFGNMPAENQTPEERTFLSGGFYLTNRGEGKAGFPTYPEEFGGEGMYIGEEMYIFAQPLLGAERVERLIRKRIVKAVKIKNGEINRKDAYKAYRKIGLYIALLDLEGRTNEEILEKIESFDLLEIDEYYNFFREKAISALRALKDKDFFVMALRAVVLIRLEMLNKNSDEYRQLYAYPLIKKKEWEEVVKLGEAAIPAIEAALRDESYLAREEAAEVLKIIRGNQNHL